MQVKRMKKEKKYTTYDKDVFSRFILFILPQGMKRSLSQN